MAALGLIITLAAVVVVAWEAIQPRRPPDLTARIVAVHRTASGWVAEVEVANTGLDTAAAVDLEADDGRAAATLDYVPGQGEATAYLHFDRDPSGLPVAVRGWSAP